MLGISQLKTMLIFPESLRKSKPDTLEHLYPGSSLIGCATTSGHQADPFHANHHSGNVA